MSREVGIDLGTTNVVIHLKGRGIVLNEPAVIAVDLSDQSVIAVGSEAKALLGRNPEKIQVAQPLKGGVVSDFDLTEAMLVLFLEQIHYQKWFTKPKFLICCPARVTQVEQQSLIEAAQIAGGGDVYIEPEPKVAALGAGIDIMDHEAHMIIDIGGGTTDVAVITRGQVVDSRTLKVAGDDFDQAIIQYFKAHHHLLVGLASAQAIKEQVGSAVHVSHDELKIEPLKGRNLITGLPVSLNAHSNHIHEAIAPLLLEIERLIREMMQDLPPEIASDILQSGITLTGGSAMLYHLDTYLTQALSVSVIRCEQPLSSVAIGTGLMLELIAKGHFDHERLTWGQRWSHWWKRTKRRWLGF